MKRRIKIIPLLTIMTYLAFDATTVNAAETINNTDAINQECSEISFIAYETEKRVTIYLEDKRIAMERERSRIEFVASESKRLEEERIKEEKEKKEKQRILEEKKKKEKQLAMRSRHKKSGLTKSSGVNYYKGWKETYYSSRVLYHYRTREWTVDSNGVYRDSKGYVVVASSSEPQGTITDTSFGPGKVYDTGCAKGVHDIYVNW